MASKDYVRRGSGSKRKPAPKKTRRPLPVRSGLIAIAAVSIFGYGLTFLSQSPEPPKKQVSRPAPAPKPKATKKEVLPPPPAQEWDYEKILPNKEIEVTAKELVVSEIPYIMQCGAYKTMAQAEERKAMIAFQGITSKIRKKEESSWYRVVLGPYKFKRDAERDKHKLQRAKIEPCAIWKEPQ